MSISSFYGLQTSLRGLLAQQRALDTTGHNIANASTKGYSRQQAVMAASPGLEIASGAVQGGAGAHIGSGVDIQAYRRVRDTFLDLQYRAQATRLGQEAGRAEGLDRAELALAEPSDNGINKQLSDFWNAWSNLSEAPPDQAAREALVEQAKSLAEAFATVDQQFALVGEQARSEFDSLTQAGGELEQISNEIVALNDTIRRFVTAGDAPNDLMDQRDLLLDRLSELGQTSITDNGDGSVSVTFGATGTPMIDATGFHFQPPATLGNAGGRLGALQSLSNVPGGELDTFRLELGQVATSIAAAVNQVYDHAGDGTNFFTTTGPYAAGTMALAAGVTAATVRTGTTGEADDNKLALQIAELRGDAPDGAYRAFIARVGSEVREATRNEANAQALTDAVMDRRDSVAGVSLDEEMGSLVRFQRAYQASARAMSTMDEMLDVLINRTGRVGL